MGSSSFQQVDHRLRRDRLCAPVKRCRPPPDYDANISFMNDSQLLEIRDEWCREMARQAMRDAKEIDARITAARANRLAGQSSPESTHALDMEIAKLQRIREELESDVEDWVG
jgi:hypothetical protein